MSAQGFTACWRCEEPLACADANTIPVHGLTVDVSLCDDCAAELAEITEDAKPSLEQLHGWKYEEAIDADADADADAQQAYDERRAQDLAEARALSEPFLRPALPRVSVTVKLKTTGEVLARVGDRIDGEEMF